MSFVEWWEKDGRFIDPDTDDVPWFDKRRELCEMAWDAALKQAAAKLEANCVKYGHEICNCGVDLDTL